MRSISSAYDQRRGSAIVETERGVLLVSSSGGYFRLPGGKPEKGEASIQTAIRELREETGLRAFDVRYLFKFHESKIFKIRANGEPIPSNEIHYLVFFTPKKQMDAKVSHNTLEILEKYYKLKKTEKVKNN